MKEVVSISAATLEVEGWLDYHKIMPLQKESFKESISVLIEGVQYGMLALKDNAFSQKLLFPVGTESKIESLDYKVRINSNDVDDKMKGVKQGDAAGMILAIWAALTDQPKLILKSLDKADKRIANSIVVFFLET